jgi:hypothetical protein
MGAWEPLVSVVCITFNHAAFVRRALDGFVAQRTNFPFEVIVHDDASSDATAAIVREYAERHPEVIVPVLQTENQYSQGRKPWTICFPMARGKYIALCEGDDHWIDPLKLQKQVDAMEADPNAVGCFTDAWNEHDGVRTSYMDGIYASKPEGSILEQRDMVLLRNIPSCTFLFRREHLFPLPEVFPRSPVGDTMLYVHLTRAGHLRYLRGHTAVRVMHTGGMHALTRRLHRIRVKERLWPLLDEMTEGRYRSDIDQAFTTMYRREWNMALQAGDRDVLKHVWSRAVGRRRQMGWGWPTTLRNLFKAWAPALDRMIGVLRGR